MFVTSYLLSLLAQQRAMLKERFLVRFPHPWLVWEPGRWKPPDSSRATMLPTVHESPARDGDALCFSLQDKGGHGLWVGRSDQNDLVVNDATVSRSHVRLKLSPGVVTVEVGHTAQPAKVHGAPLPPGAFGELRSGEQLQLGNVLLTLLDPEAMAQRLDGHKRPH